MAAREGHDDIVRELLQYGATIDRRDEHGDTALDVALSARNKLMNAFVAQNVSLNHFF